MLIISAYNSVSERNKIIMICDINVSGNGLRREGENARNQDESSRWGNL